MEYQIDLKQLALAALILASAAPFDSQADQTQQQSLYLAAGCPAHGCPAKANNQIVDNQGKDQEGYYHPKSSREENSKPVEENRGNGNPAVPQTEKKGQGSSKAENLQSLNSAGYLSPAGELYAANTVNGYYRDGAYTSVDRYNSQHSGVIAPTYIEDYRSNTIETRPLPTPEWGGLTNFNREYNTTTDYDYNRGQVTTVASQQTLTEAQLIGVLSSKGRSIYLNLDPEGKALAIQLASQDSYRDKDIAVREAQRRMNQRRGLLYR